MMLLDIELVVGGIRPCPALQVGGSCTTATARISTTMKRSAERLVLDQCPVNAIQCLKCKTFNRSNLSISISKDAVGL